MNPKNTHVDTTQTTTHIGLCAGYGGIELGLKRVIPDLRTVALCEIEAFACANLVAKMEAGLLEPAPIWTDLKTFPWAGFRGKVDILTGGYPCQPFSAAGKRAGKDDPRHLWPWIADGIRLLQPRCCFFENVEGHITLGLSTVISDLEEMGYRTTWGIFSASEVGAPHQRKRVFILAHDQRQRIEELSRWIADESQQHPAWNDGGDVWPSRPGEQQHEWEPPRVVGAVPAKLADFCSRDSQSWGDTTQTSGESVGTWEQSEDAMPNCGSSLCGGDQGNESTPRVVANAASAGLRKRQEDKRNAELAWSSQTMGNATQLFGNGGDDHTGVSERSEKVSKPREPSGEGVGNADSTRSQERSWQRGAGLQGTDSDGREDAEWEAQSALGRDADGPTHRMDDAKLYVTHDNRTDELRLLGNGVVPATAERAFRVLMAKL